MLTFLRKIRKTLIDTGNIRKYLIYAIGEIALVVFGILIALQINNWNENKRDRHTEKQILIDLQASVSNNQEMLSSGVERWKSTLEAIAFVSTVIEQKPSYSDSLARYFMRAHQNRGSLLNGLDFAGYKGLESEGFKILTNHLLQQDIIDLFEHRLPRLSASNIQLDFDNSGFHYEYIAKQFLLDKTGEIPINYLSILEDPFYYSILKRLESSLEAKMRRVNGFLEINQEVLQLLEQELALRWK